jgi:formyl-CoA transferase
MGTGFGSSGPYQHKGGQDVLAQAMSGVMHRRADDSLPLSVYATTLCDYTAGMHLVQAILMAIIARTRTDHGQIVEVSLYDSMLAMQIQEAAMQLIEGRELNWAAMPLSGVFETTDGAIVMVGAFKQNPLRDICTALEIDDLSEQYPTLEVQRQHKATLQQIFRETFASNSNDYWLQRLEQQDLLCAPVKSLAAALEDPQTLHNQMIARVPYGDASINLIGSPVHMSATPFTIRHAPPRLGQHSVEILAELGYSDEKIEQLQQQRVIA